MDFEREIKGHVLKYVDDTHTYTVDGVKVPSITQVVKAILNTSFDGIDPEVLEKARVHGNEVHRAIELYCKIGFDVDVKEVRNFKFLQKQYGFTVVENEAPVILFHEDKPISAGRLDLVLEMDGELGGADIKSTSSLNKEYVAWQLNLYRRAYMQCYDKEWKFLRAVHLKEDKRKFVKIPINEAIVDEAINKIINGVEDVKSRAD